MSGVDRKNRKKKLKKLAVTMNKRNSRILPIVPPILDLIDFMIDNYELDYLVKFENKEYSFEEVYSLSGFSQPKFENLFETVKKKGFINIRRNGQGKEYFSLNPVVVGWVEIAEYYHRGKPNEEEFHIKLNNIFDYFRKFNIFPFRNIANIIGKLIIKPNQEVRPFISQNENMIIEVDREIKNPGYEVYPMKTINDLILERGKKDSIFVTRCVCRNMKKSIGKPCGLEIPEESCLFFGDRGIGYTAAAFGYGRKISQNEAIDILQEVSEKGAVHSVFYEKDDLETRSEIAVCNCCWDCCGILGGYNNGSMLTNYRTYFYACVENIDECNGCGKCVKRCPTMAISLVDKKVLINKERCIGCFQCSLQCPQKGVLKMMRENRDVLLPLLEKSERRQAL